MDLRIGVVGGQERETTLVRTAIGGVIWIDGREHRLGVDSACEEWRLEFEGRAERLRVAVVGDRVYVHAFGRAWELGVSDPMVPTEREADATDVAAAPMPGTVVSVAVDAGDQVVAGQVLLVIESMKMQSEIAAWRDGVVERVHHLSGEAFGQGAPLLSLVSQSQALEAVAK